jgi:hypothetical protein
VRSPDLLLPRLLKLCGGIFAFNAPASEVFEIDQGWTVVLNAIGPLKLIGPLSDRLCEGGVGTKRQCKREDESRESFHRLR